MGLQHYSSVLFLFWAGMEEAGVFDLGVAIGEAEPEAATGGRWAGATPPDPNAEGEGRRKTFRPQNPIWMGWRWRSLERNRHSPDPLPQADRPVWTDRAGTGQAGGGAFPS